jgi:MFS family permease
MRANELLPAERAEIRPRILAGTREALAYVRRTPRAGTVLVLVAVISTFAFNFNVLLPVLAKNTLHAGPATFGVITGCFGAGALVGALIAATLGRASMRMLLICMAGFGLAELLLAPLHTAPATGLMLFLVGLSFTMWTANANSTLQLEAPGHLRGRVVGLYYYAFNGAGPVGGILSGWLAATGGTGLAFAVGGVLTLGAIGIVVLRSTERPAVRLAHLLNLKL